MDMVLPSTAICENSLWNNHAFMRYTTLLTSHSACVFDKIYVLSFPNLTEYQRWTTRIIFSRIHLQLVNGGMRYFAWIQSINNWFLPFCKFWTFFHLFIKYISFSLGQRLLDFKGFSKSSIFLNHNPVVIISLTVEKRKENSSSCTILCLYK